MLVRKSVRRLSHTADLHALSECLRQDGVGLCI